MMKQEIKVSGEFKKSASKSIFAIVLFIIVYMALLSLAIGLTIVSCYLGIKIMASFSGFGSLIGGVALIALGFLVLFFLFKFIFTTSTKDTSHLIEISALEYPQLFAFIKEIVDEAGTHFPKKIFLSNEINAYVFYNSSFWSMFFPIKKNLNIGLGLVNSVTKFEFKAILAHEFGHFSQRSMKVGSFVYNVNKVIYNMLYENNSYGNALNTFSRINGIFSIVAHIAVAIITFIQLVLRQIYSFINISYMSLSRQMEFHADEVAANIAGSHQLINALLRLDLADYAFNNTLNFYNEKIEDNITSDNIYPQHKYVMNFLAKENNLEIHNNLPLVSISDRNRFNTSKIVVKDQWASHPSIADRVVKLEELNINLDNGIENTAWSLFNKVEELQKQSTKTIFSVVQYKSETNKLGLIDFEKKYNKNYAENNFNKIFDGYYDNKELVFYTEEELNILPNVSYVSFKNVFNDELKTKTKDWMAVKYDLEQLQQLSQPNIGIKTFDYDGQKYSIKDIGELVSKLENEENECKGHFELVDKQILLFFNELVKKAHKQNDYEIVKTEYKNELYFFDNYKKFFELIKNKTEFLQHTTPFEVIEQNFSELYQDELKLKAKINVILDNEKYNSIITTSMKNNFRKYNNSNLTYFMGNAYNDDSLSILFNVLNDYYYVAAQSNYIHKKKLLDFIVELDC
jgi:Zn-dependent protease with chaperone function